ncbi:MAG: hypothetical protein WC752_02615 [Patescibacteria group bacterium]|jgi:hypothetical protein
MKETKKNENKKSHIIKNPVWRSIVSALLISIFGILLFGVTFFSYYLFSLISPKGLPASQIPGIVGFCVVVIISCFIFRSKWRPLIKAIYLTQPASLLFLKIGGSFWQEPIIGFLISVFAVLVIFFFFYRMKISWMYYYAIIFMGFIFSSMLLTGQDI